MSTVHERPAARALLAARGRVFACLWAIATVLHIWNQGSGDPMTNPWLWVTLATALAVLHRPASGLRLMVLAVAQLAAFVAELPLVANHWTIVAFVNAGIVVSYLRSGRRPPDAGVEATVTHLLPYARAVLIISYGAAATAKLNTTFLDPAYSCATHLQGQLLQFFFPAVALPRGVTYGVIALTVLVEVAVPVLLLLRRTRLAGIALAAVFHLLMAAGPAIVVMDFTAVLYALLFLFAPPDFGQRVTGEMRQFGVRWASRVPTLPRHSSVVALAAIGAVAGLRSLLLGEEGFAVVSWASFLVYGSFACTVALTVLASYRRTPPQTADAPAPRLRAPVHLLLVALLAVNALSPYTGLKTTSSFTMFSNLRTEGGLTNHLFIPRIGPFDVQDDLVEVRGSSHALLQALAEDGQLVNVHEVRRRLGGDPDGWVTLVVDGRETRWGAGGEATIEPLPLLPRKLLHFRHTWGSGDPQCTA